MRGFFNSIRRCLQKKTVILIFQPAPPPLPARRRSHTSILPRRCAFGKARD
ncbi:hypothetical protein ANACOL_00073 [Anaerotruncus colihominis DSM 17241]|uniref:Uncharacterized protein n=1 Tax=Anaerotruncus colihominis DSM 17241 TaxID=445972 RepID=B0P5Q1_9FIRM|nr:hypothetical protein ANACOL_00073 [Anaerotruncus colihominis DSM 17241]